MAKYYNSVDKAEWDYLMLDPAHRNISKPAKKEEVKEEGKCPLCGVKKKELDKEEEPIYLSQD